jgi:hypothetical protein
VTADSSLHDLFENELGGDDNKIIRQPVKTESQAEDTATMNFGRTYVRKKQALFPTFI